MKVLSYNEKITVIFLIIGFLIMVSVTVYLSIHSDTKSDNKKNVHIIHVGGDVNSTKIKEKYKKFGQYDINFYNPLLNSTNVVSEDWNTIVADIGGVYNVYDSFIVVCNHYTLTYIASALSFMLENLNKPVIITDGENFLSSVKLASEIEIPEVMVVSNNKLLRGCRTTTSPESIKEFISPNYSVLDNSNCLSMPTETINIKFVDPNIRVVIVKVFSGMDENYLSYLQQNKKIQGIILEMTSTAITNNFIYLIRLLLKNGITIVAVSNYDLDEKLLQSGVLYGFDMTVEAAYTKLYFLLSNVEDKKMVKQLLQQTFRGEMSS